jgi:hypothetical protein
VERPTCGTCAYFDIELTVDNDSNLDLGRCKRHAPRPELGTEDWTTFFPETPPSEWCGEHPDFPAYITSLKKPGDEDLASETASAPGTP